MRLSVAKLRLLVSKEALVLLAAGVLQSAHGPADELRKIPVDVDGVLACQLDLAGATMLVTREARTG